MKDGQKLTACICEKGIVNGQFNVHCNLNTITVPKGAAMKYLSYVARLLFLKALDLFTGVCD